MYTRYYDSYPATPPLKISTNEESIAKTEEITEIADTPTTSEPVSTIASTGNLFRSVQADDIILIALLFLLLTESDDIIMLLIIGVLLLGDKLPI